MDLTNRIEKIRTYIKRLISIDFISKEEKVIYYLLSLSIFYDFINGIWIYKVSNTSLSVSQIIRLAVLIVLFYYIIKYGFKKIYILLPIGVFFLINAWLGYRLTGEPAGFKFDILMASKYIYFIILATSLITLYRARKITGYVIKRIVYNNALLFPFLMLISYPMGVGRFTYMNNVGFKGAFFSGNGINAAAIAFLIFAVYCLYTGKNKFQGILFTLYTMIPLLLFGTKSGFIFIAFIFFLYIILNLQNKKQTFAFLALLCLIAAVLVVVVNLGYGRIIHDLLNRQMQSLAKSDSIITTLLTYRNLFFINEYHNFMANISLRRIVLGIGSYAEQMELAKRLIANGYVYIIGNTKLKAIEMDLFDLFFAYGLVGVAITYGYVLKVFIENIRRAFLPENQPYTITIICFLIFSLLGGHVFGEPTASTFMALVLSGLATSCRKTRGRF